MKNNILSDKKRIIKRFIILFIALIVGSITYSCFKENNVPPVYSEIPDANFKAYLKTIVPEAFTPDNKFISNHPSVVSYDGTIYIELKKITSLEGIEYFTNLTGLNCMLNKLITLDVSKNIALTRLSCSGNQLASLDISKNVNLKTLECSSNQLSTLDVSKNTNLTELNCCCNLITTLKLGDNEVLRKIYCPYNQLTVLDVTKNKALIELNCVDNPRNTVVIIDPNKLSRLYIDSFIKCNHPSIKAFKDRGGDLYGTYSEVISTFTCQ